MHYIQWYSIEETSVSDDLGYPASSAMNLGLPGSTSFNPPEYLAVLKDIVCCCQPWSCGGNPSPCGLVHDERCDERKDEPHNKHSPEEHLEAHVARDQPQPQQSHRLRWEREGGGRERGEGGRGGEGGREGIRI